VTSEEELISMELVQIFELQPSDFIIITFYINQKEETKVGNVWEFGVEEYILSLTSVNREQYN
jgi:hypothetical protein